VLDVLMMIPAVVSAKVVWRQFLGHRAKRKLWEMRRLDKTPEDSRERGLQRLFTCLNMNLFKPMRDLFGRFWSIFDFCLFLISIAYVIIRNICIKTDSVVLASYDNVLEIAGILGLGAWLKLLHFFTAFGPTAPVVELLFAVIRDMASFLLVLLIFIVGFSMPFYAVGTYNTIFSSFVRLFAMMLSSFELTDFDQAVSPNYATGIFIIFMLVVAIILLNALIVQSWGTHLTEFNGN